jgi:hypothetical protein
VVWAAVTAVVDIRAELLEEEEGCDTILMQDDKIHVLKVVGLQMTIV